MTTKSNFKENISYEKYLLNEDYRKKYDREEKLQPVAKTLIYCKDIKLYYDAHWINDNVLSVLNELNRQQYFKHCKFEKFPVEKTLPQEIKL